MDRLQPIYSWQKDHWSHLTHAVLTKKLAHGLLFSGTPGIGKTHLAQHLVAYLHCENPSEAACGCCRACYQILSGQNPDHMNLDLSEKARFITVDDVRLMTDWLAQTAHGGRCQTVIIHQADRLNRAAANALLKTLEEPPGESYIILLDQQRAPLLPTILSRLHVIDCTQVPRSLVVDYLADKHGDNANLLYDLFYGAPLSEVNANDLLSCRDKLFQSLLMLKDNNMDVVLLSDRMLKTDLDMLLNLWSSILLDMLRLSCGFSVERVTHSDRSNALLALLHNVSYSFLLRMVNELNYARFHWGGANHLNQSLLLNRLLLMWQCGGL